MTVIKRGNGYYLKRKRPKKYARVDDRVDIWLSLGTDSLEEAHQKHDAVWAQLIEGWELLRIGDNEASEKRFETAKQLASSRGFKFLTPDRIAKLPLQDILDRVGAVKSVKNKQLGAEAFLGTAKPPTLTISKALDEYFKYTTDKLRGKSPDQIRRWGNPRKKAVKNFIEVIGDKDIFDITRDDMLDFWEWWRERIENEGLTPNSANKDMTHLSDVLRKLSKIKRFDHQFPVGDLTFADMGSKKRPPFSSQFIREKIIPNLGGLNDQARGIVLMLINTGARPSEIAGLLPHHFRLDDNIPHIQIRPEGRQLKTKQSERDIPLLGVSLEAGRIWCATGFPTYQFRDKFSDTANKYFRENGLIERQGQTIYSFRHAFEDRLLMAGVDERIRADLMGHSFERPNYGEGGGLVAKLDAIAKIAL